MTDSELLATIFGAEAHPLREACVVWIASSRPFRMFLEANASKIRKKARQAGDLERLRDVQLEMDAAYHLLTDQRVALAYERYLADKTRGPDFTVTFKGHLIFNVEVRRLRAPIATGKLAEGICEKLRQMPPNEINVLLVGADASPSTDDLDAAATIKRLVLRAEAKQEDFFLRRGFRDAREFLHALQRLSGLLLCANWYDAPPASPILWLNPQARRPLPSDVQKLLRR